MNNGGLADTVGILERHGDLVRIDEPIDPYLELAYIQRRAYANQSKAILFQNVKGTEFPVLINLFASKKRCEIIFGPHLETAKELIKAKSQGPAYFKSAIGHPLRSAGLGLKALNALPRKCGAAPVLSRQTDLRQLPQITSWPKDGGAFITLPQVYSEDPSSPGVHTSNIGMYRIQISGNEYADNEAGLHY